MDGDYKDSLKHLCELQWELQQQKVEAALEQSRRGAHLWIFGEQPLFGSTVPAADIRLGSETRYPGKRSRHGRRNRDIPEGR